MKLLLTFCFAMLVTAGISQSAEQYFNKIRNNEAALTAFFSMMPKGGDLHHHYSGSVYAETFLQYAIAEDLYHFNLKVTPGCVFKRKTFCWGINTF
jgi:adenosine deaminase/adenosine deaminase CECR1